MTFEEFRATAKLMTPAEYDADNGTDIAEWAKEGDMVRNYEGGRWILYQKDGSHWMHIETDEYSTDDGYTLRDIEDVLYRWDRPDEDEDEDKDKVEQTPGQTPGEDADNEQILDWRDTTITSRKQMARLAAALLMPFLDPEGGAPDMEAARIFADEIGPDYTMSLIQLAAEIHKRA